MDYSILHHVQYMLLVHVHVVATTSFRAAIDWGRLTGTV